MNESRISIRPAVVSDVKDIVQLVRASFNREYLISSIYQCHGIEKFITAEIQNHNSPYLYYVVVQDKTIVGYTEYKMFPDLDMVFLNIIATSSQHKGSGVGKSIFNFTKKIFLQKEIKSIGLDVFFSNTVARNWYLSLGFSEGESKNVGRYRKGEESTGFDNIFILNYPQYSELLKIYGFTYLNLIIEKSKVDIGIINTNAIITSNIQIEKFYARLYSFLIGNQISDLYFIGKDSVPESFESVDQIIRMNLKLQ